jgi:hypothetical protein
MKNLPKEKQSAASFTLPSKKPDRLKLFLFLGLGLAVLILIGEGIYWYKLKNEKKEKAPSLTESQTQPKEESLVDVSKISLPCPVPEEYCKKAEEIGYSLGFRLPIGTEIKAVTSGVASVLKSSLGDVVIELRSSSGSALFYTFQSDDHLTSMRPVEVGFVLGKSEGLTKDQHDYNLLIKVVDENSNYYSKPIDLFKR